MNRLLAKIAVPAGGGRGTGFAITGALPAAGARKILSAPPKGGLSSAAAALDGVRFVIINGRHLAALIESFLAEPSKARLGQSEDILAIAPILRRTTVVGSMARRPT